MIAKLTLCLLAAATLASCQTTSTVQRDTLAERRATELAAVTGEPAPPAEGPDEIAEDDPQRNPGLVPSPLLRNSAASSL